MANEIGHGFELGPSCTGYEVVRRARKTHSCEGAMVNSDSFSRGELSPGTGGLVSMGASDNCTWEITTGDLYVSQEFTGEHAEDLGAEYRYTFRTCIDCALEFTTIRKSNN